MIREHLAPSAIVQSVHDAAIREINALEQRIVKSEDDADAKLWEQARQVVERLEAGMTQQELAREWINARTGKPYNQAHVSRVRKVFGYAYTHNPRPSFRETYNATANVHVSNNTGDHEWYTPPEYTRAAADVMQGIDLDPASCELANRTVGAVRYFSAEDDGLAQDWSGRVWMNPPYAQPLVSQFCARLIEQFTSGRVAESVVLVNNASDTLWFQDVLGHAAAICFIAGRVKFLDRTGEWRGQPLQGQVAFYFGPHALRFRDRFAEFGPVVRIAWPDGKGAA